MVSAGKLAKISAGASVVASLLVTKLGHIKVNPGDSPRLKRPFSPVPNMPLKMHQ
jgi:hypothetical protein